MKLKLQDGGVVSYTPFTYNPGTVSSKSSTEDKKEKITGTLQKEIVDILKQNGIPSDVNAFMDKANSYLSQSQSLSNMAIFGGTDTDYTMQQLMQIQKMANEVKFNHETYKDAAANLGNEDAWGDLALNDRGQMYVLDNENKLKQVSISDYKEHTDDYRALTYSNLMGLRERDLAMDVSVLNDVKNAVGMKSIADHIKNIATAFGENSAQYYTTNKESVKRGLNAIMGQEDAYYKVSESTKVDDMNRAIGFLYSNLAPAMRNRLRAEAAINGQDPHEYLVGYLQTSLQEYNKTDKKIDFDSSKTEFHNGDAETNANKGTTEGTLPIEVAMGNLTETTAYISPVAQRVSDKAQMAMKAWNAGSLQDRQGDGLHANNLKDLLPVAYQAKSADISSVTFGNQLLKDHEIASVIWDGSSLATRVALPVKYVNGKQTPDFELLVNLNELNGWIKDNPGLTQLEINKKMQELQSDGVTYDETTKTFTVSPDRIGMFLSFAGYGSKDLLEFKEESIPFLEKVPRSYGKQIKDLFNNLVQYGDATPSKKAKTKYNFGSSEAGDFYYGNVYVPISDPLQATLLTKNQNYSKSIFTDSSKKAALGNEIQTAANNSQWKTNF